MPKFGQKRLILPLFLEKQGDFDPKTPFLDALLTKLNSYVYGTLGLGAPNEHVLSVIGGTWEEASVRGYLRPEGWGNDAGYPGIVLDDAADQVNGYLFTSDNFDAHWDRLDAFEGDEYERVLTTVNLKNGTTMKAYIYTLK